MQVKIYNQAGKSVGEMELPKVFDAKVNRDLVHQVVTSQDSNQRIVRAKTKDRAEVRGGGKKPWRQKGTGRARHGSIRSPLWKGGGTTHGPRVERNFKKKINKKMANLALAMVLGEKARGGEMVIFDELSVQSAKTKDAAKVFSGLSKEVEAIHHKSALVILPDGSIAEGKAFRNLRNVEIRSPRQITAFEVLKHVFVVLPKTALSQIESRLK